MVYFDMTGLALLMSPKGQTRPEIGLVKLVVAMCLFKFSCYFAIYYVLGL